VEFHPLVPLTILGIVSLISSPIVFLRSKGRGKGIAILLLFFGLALLSPMVLLLVVPMGPGD